MTDQEVQNLIKEFRVPLHVRKHCEAVADFAVKLGQKFIEAGEKVDLKLIRQAALLHDLVRVADFKNLHPAKFPYPVKAADIEYWESLRKKYGGKHHAIAGAEILEERGYRDIANLVRKHRFLQVEDSFNTWEEKILYYADKRVKHDKIVSLEERLHDGKIRNAPSLAVEKKSPEVDGKVFALEREIFAKIGGPL